MRVCLFFLAAVMFAGYADAQSPTAPTIGAQAYLLFDASTGKVLLEKNSREQRPVASTQKLLTALLVAEAGDLDREVEIKPVDTTAAPTKLYLQPGQRYTRRKLVQALLVRSPNDVAAALARDHSGSVEAFAEAMNRRMMELRGTDSNFRNPHGLPDEQQYSTARDMAIVARAVYFHPTLREIVRIPAMNFRRGDGNTLPLQNTNRVLRTYEFCNGMKTGYTRLSGHCLISSGTWNGRHVIAVVLGSNRANIWDESTRLLAYGLGISPAALPNHRRPGAN